MVDTLATEHQISDGVGVGIGTTPADGFTSRGAHPDHALLSPQFADPESVVHIGRPGAPVRIELTPGAGLNCDCVGHRCFVWYATIISTPRATLATPVDTLRTDTEDLPATGRAGIK